MNLLCLKLNAGVCVVLANSPASYVHIKLLMHKGSICHIHCSCPSDDKTNDQDPKKFTWTVLKSPLSLLTEAHFKRSYGCTHGHIFRYSWWQLFQSFVSLFLVPGQPLNFKAEPESETSILLSWTPPRSDTIASYELVYKDGEHGEEVRPWFLLHHHLSH
jgi:hypothetical protein